MMGIYGVINFNNMIPVTSNNYVEYDLYKVTTNINEKNRLNLLQNQLRWLTSNKKVVYDKSRVLYNLYKYNKLHRNIKNRCCNFILLEAKCYEYNNEK